MALTIYDLAEMSGEESIKAVINEVKSGNMTIEKVTKPIDENTNLFDNRTHFKLSNGVIIALKDDVQEDDIKEMIKLYLSKE